MLTRLVAIGARCAGRQADYLEWGRHRGVVVDLRAPSPGVLSPEAPLRGV